MSSESEVELSSNVDRKGGGGYSSVAHEGDDDAAGDMRESIFEVEGGDADEDADVDDGNGEEGGSTSKKKKCWSFSANSNGDLQSNYHVTEGDNLRNKDMVKKHPKMGLYYGTCDAQFDLVVVDAEVDGGSSPSDGRDKKEIMNPTGVNGRSCTDSLILVALLLAWAAMSVIGYTAYLNGQPYRLLGPIDSLGRVCGYDDAVASLPKFYTVSQYGLGTCVKDCFSYNAPVISTSASDYVCLPLDIIPDDATLRGIFISQFCMDKTVSPPVYDPSTNCGCNLIYDTKEYFRRCRFTDTAVASDYVTQSKPDFLNAFISDGLKTYQVIFSFGFVAAILLSFILIRLFHYESIGKALIWMCICGVVGLMIAMLLLAQQTVVIWENEDPKVHSTQSILALKAFSAVLAGLAFLYSCMIVFLRKRINTAVKAISLAARAVDAMPIIVFTPMLQVIGFACFMLPCVVFCFYLATDGYFVDVFETVPYTNAKVAVGKQYQLNEGVAGKLWYLFFCLLWTMNFLVAIGSLVVALAVSRWYFTMPNKRWREITGFTVLMSYYKALRYHAGTAALGGLLVSLIQFAKAVVAYIERHMPKKQRERCIVKFVFCMVQCFLSCLERCMKFISKHAYIQTAIHSTSFMVSAKNAFFTIARNIFLIGVVAAISDMGILVGKVFVCLLSTAACYYYLNNYYASELYDLVAPTMMVMLISWITVTMFMDVFSISIDTIIMCYLTDMEQNDGKKAAFVDKNTSFFIITHQKAEDLERRVQINAQSSYRRGSLDSRSHKEIADYVDNISKSSKRKSINLADATNLAAHGSISSSSDPNHPIDNSEHLDDNSSGENPYRPDAGRPLDLDPKFWSMEKKIRPRPHLSTKKALDFSYLNRPMEYVTVFDEHGNRTEKKKWTNYPLSQYFGRFRGPFETFCRKDTDAPEKQTILSIYGPGVAFYFRMLKTLGITFTILSLITFPSLIIYSMASNISKEELTITAIASSETMLALTTIAAFSEPVATCRETHDKSVFGFKCPAPYIISSVVGYFGQDHGHCACPLYNQPLSSGFCKTQPLTSTYPGKCAADPLTGVEYGCFQFVDRYSNDCCSGSVDINGNPDTSIMDLHVNSTCNSVTAPVIAIAMCEGKEKCSFEVNTDPSFKYSFPVSKIPNDIPISEVCENTYYDGELMCETSLSYTKDGRDPFSSCDPRAYSNFIFEAVCVNIQVQIGTQKLDPTQAVAWASYLDAAAILFFIATVYWMRYTIGKEEEDANKFTCTASDYTVVCKTIPAHEIASDAPPEVWEQAGDVIKQKVKDFFEEKIALYARTQRTERGEVLTKDDLEEIKDTIKVADINISTKYTHYIRSAITRGESAYRIDILINKISSQLHRKIFDETRPGGMQLMRDLTRAILQFEIANDDCKKLSPVAQSSVYQAFITFKNEESYIQCLSAFPNVGFLTPFVQDSKYRMDAKMVTLPDGREVAKGGQLVRLRRADAPSEIIWENVAIPWWNRGLRVIFTTIASIVILGISYAIIYQAKYSSSKFITKSKVQSCSTFNVILNKAVDNSSSNDITYQKVIWDENPAYYHSLYPNDNQTTYGSLGFANCYCQSVLANLYDGNVEKMQDYTFYDPYYDQDMRYCDTFFGAAISNSIASYLATLVIVVINVSMQYFMRFAVAFESHGNKTAAVVSLSMKLFVLQFINTGILTLIISGNLSRIHVENLKFATAGIVEFGLFTGKITDFNKTWYFSVGSSLMFTMFTFVFSTMPYQVYTILYIKAKKLWDRRWDFKATTTHLDLQFELDELYLGPEPAFEMKYASLVSLIFVDLTYSAAMPLLYPITALNICLIYFLEKYLFLRVTKAPNVLNADIARNATLVMLLAAGIHACFGLWMFSNSQFYAPFIAETKVWTGSYFVMTHSWDPPVVWSERLYGRYSWHLFIIALVIGGLIGVQLAHVIVFEYLGMRPLFNNFFYLLKKKFACLKNVPLPIVEFEAEGNHPYFEAIKLEVLKYRVASGLLDKGIQENYLMEIQRKMVIEMEKMNIEMERANQEMYGDSDKPDLGELDKAFAENELEENARRRKRADGSTPVDGETPNDEDFDLDCDDVLIPKQDDGDDEPVLRKIITSTSDGADIKTAESRDSLALTPRVGGGGDAGDDDSSPRSSAARKSLARGSKDKAIVKLMPSLSKKISEFTASQQNRDLIGHESYNIATLPEYITKFGLESVHFRRVRPTDWVVSHAQLAAPPKDSPELQKVLEDCKPIRNADGEISWWDRTFNA